jgi:acyltransferase
MSLTKINDSYVILNPSKQRIEWIDVAKGIGILLVVLGHSGFSLNIRWWIWSFHMPLFLLLSGLVFSINKYPDFSFLFEKRNISLLRPYFLFTLIVLLLLFFIQPDYPYLVKSTIIYGWATIALWFIPVLYLTEFLYYFIRKNLSDKQTLLFLILNSLFGYALSRYNVHIPYKVEVIFTSVLFYGIGNLFFSEINKALNRFSMLVVITAGLFCLLINLVFCYLNYIRFDMSSNSIGNYFCAYISALSGISFIILISFLITSNGFTARLKSLFTYFGVNTLIILALHQLIKLYLVFVLEKMKVSVHLSLLLRHLLLWTFLVIFIYLINRYLPYIIGREKKPKTRLQAEIT